MIKEGEASNAGGAVSYSSFAELKEKFANFEDPFSRLDIRVGKIDLVQKHPLASKTYVNHVYYDEVNSRAAIAKIAGPYNKKSLKNKLVIFVLNIKHKVRYFESESFILYARDEEKDIIELLEPPADSEVGDRIIAQGVPYIPTINMPYIKPMSEGKKMLDEVTANMLVDSEGYAMYKGFRLSNVMNDLVTVPTLRNCPIQR